ncbi:MAG: patatin-like phospholipase family protein [Candidatus Marinimicrobia bacterium]|nr:patatin-like phospholipase family protein [Candidatus Neomarinimicrobiota bacterium]
MQYLYKNLIYFSAVFSVFFFTLLSASSSTPKIGLVLSGGGSKGFAHVAVLKALDSLNIPVDYIAGTSFGAIAGAMYALGYPGKEIEQMALDTDWYEVQNDEPERRFLPYFRKKDTGKYQLEFGLDGVKPVTPTGFIYGQKIILELSKWTREFEQTYDFDNFPIPFRCNAFDIISGKEIILKEGSLAHALRASISVPTIFAPVEWGDALLVDGGVINNLPVDIVREMGADIVLALDVTSERRTVSSLDNMYDIFDQTISVHGYERKNENIKNADFYLQPHIPNINWLDYSKSNIHQLFLAGEEAVRQNKNLFDQLAELTKNRTKKIVNLKPIQKPRIIAIHLNGNNDLPDKFILEYLGIVKNKQLDVQALDENISELYSLGYFKVIHYDINPLSPGRAEINIHVKENPMRKFQMGLRWDNFYQMVGVANVQINSNIIPGMRFENQTQFAGLRRNDFSVFFPSRKLNFPVYPYVRAKNIRRTYKLYSSTRYEGMYNFSQDELNGGVGLLLRNYWNTEIEFFHSRHSFTPEIENATSQYSFSREIFSGVRMRAQLDLLDDVLLPFNGILIKGEYENSSPEFGAERNYHFYHGLGDVYFSRKRNTFRIMAYYHQALNDIPRYYITIPGGSQALVGISEFQLYGNTLAFSRFEYRYKHKKDIFLHLIGGWLVSAKSEDNSVLADNLWSSGAGVTLLSPVGPLEFIWCRGPVNIYSETDFSWQNIFHFSAGYKF